ncbi:hypothetical protein [Zeaxanthinibacter enoshimensis]|uniref:Uncharacterized protein n=1 Tax=Zeaxanthinibacter enoshimensis TaxID=392009 RepID=A0A4R6TQ70_9FLAO|nr:hypothetical protein [Zeaxanthinibacter enoshimensis]TDQ32427.1 hypothetical protein CLV82_0255 [Zeaxanthinibacter enoshimensis]
MSRPKYLRYITTALLLFGFITAGSLSSCRDQKKKDGEEQTIEEGAVSEDEHPTGEEHPAKDEHPKGEEHPSKEEGEHPTGEEHPTKDSVSG